MAATGMAPRLASTPPEAPCQPLQSQKAPFSFEMNRLSIELPFTFLCFYRSPFAHIWSPNAPLVGCRTQCNIFNTNEFFSSNPMKMLELATACPFHFLKLWPVNRKLFSVQTVFIRISPPTIMTFIFIHHVHNHRLVSPRKADILDLIFRNKLICVTSVTIQAKNHNPFTHIIVIIILAFNVDSSPNLEGNGTVTKNALLINTFTHDIANDAIPPSFLLAHGLSCKFRTEKATCTDF